MCVLGEESVVECLPSSELTSDQITTHTKAYSIAVFVEGNAGNEDHVQRVGIDIQHCC